MGVFLQLRPRQRHGGGDLGGQQGIFLVPATQQLDLADRQVVRASNGQAAHHLLQIVGQGASAGKQRTVAGTHDVTMGV